MRLGELSLEQRAVVVVSLIRAGLKDMKDHGASANYVWMYLGKLETLENLCLIEESVYAELKAELENFL